MKSKRVDQNKNMPVIAYDTIKHSIIKNELKPGDLLSENSLASEMGMSRTPVREALKILAKEGYVSIRNGVGIYVKHITLKEVLDIYEVRANLETLALQSSLNNILDSEIDSLLEVWLALDDKQKNGFNTAEEELLDNDLKLHSFIINKSDNDFLKILMKEIQLKTQRFQAMSSKAINNGQETIKQHIEILNLMKERDLKKLTTYNTWHIMKSANIIVNKEYINL